MAHAPLSRPLHDRKLAGVCAGIARYLDMDVKTVRIATVILAFLTVHTIVPVAYLLAWALIPEEGTGRVMAKDVADSFDKTFTKKPSGDPRIAPVPPQPWQQQPQQWQAPQAQQQWQPQQQGSTQQQDYR